MFLAFIIACSQIDIVETDAYTNEHEVCSLDAAQPWTIAGVGDVRTGKVKPSDECGQMLRDDFGMSDDPRLTLVVQAAWSAHIFSLNGDEVDFYNYAAARVVSTTFGACDDTEAAACISGAGELTVQRPEDVTGPDGFAVLVHEARHVDSDTPNHVACWSGGPVECDKNTEGAYTSQLDVHLSILDAIEQAGGDDRMFEHEDQTISAIADRILAQ